MSRSSQRRRREQKDRRETRHTHIPSEVRHVEDERIKTALVEKLVKLRHVRIRSRWRAVLVVVGLGVVILVTGHARFVEAVLAMGIEMTLHILWEVAIILEE